MRLFRAAIAAALSLCPSLAHAQAGQGMAGKPISLNDPFLKGVAVYCDDGTNHAVICPSNAVPSTSTPALGTVTSTGVTGTSGTAPAFAGGAATIPFTPQLGLPIRVILKGSATFTAYVGTSVDGCATINPLTIGGQQWGSFSGPADEFVDTPVTTAVVAGITYCLKATVTSGTLTYGVRQ